MHIHVHVLECEGLVRICRLTSTKKDHYFCFRNCGGVFCGWCSNKSALVKNELLSSPVRVCDGCFDKLDGHLQRENGVKLQNLSSERNTICNAT